MDTEEPSQESILRKEQHALDEDIITWTYLSEICEEIVPRMTRRKPC